MPYYTKKGTSKKDKGKTCVYKKEDNTKVGCTAGPIEKYLAALHIHESSELDWLKEPTQIKFGDVRGELYQFFKEGEKVYLTGELVIDAGGDRFITLNRTLVNIDQVEKNRLKVSFGEEITNLPIWQSEFNDNYVHLGDVLKDNEIMIALPEKRINESIGLEWISDIGSDTEKFIQELSKLIKQHVPVAELELDWDTTSDGSEYFGRVWLYDTFYELYKYDKTFTFRIYRFDPETDEYHMFNQYSNLPQTRLLTVLLNDMISVSKQNLRESEEDLDWVRGVEIDLIPGEIYDIKTGNGYYWVPEIYIGREWDDEYEIEFYKFKDLDGSGSGRKSIPYVKDLMEKGNIRPYDPNWSIKDELTFSDNIEDTLKGNFVIYFKDGVYLDETLSLQDKLFEMGFSFYTKGPNEYITDKDSSGKIQFFECFNWDISNPRYSKMPSDQWDKKKILLVSFDEGVRSWGRTINPRLEEQELFLTIRDHNAIVINGDKYTTQNIDESEEGDLNWIKDIKPDELSLSPDVFFRSDDEMFYTLDQLGFDIEDMSVYTMSELAINCGYRWSEENNGWYHRDEVIDFNSLNESEDFGWIQKQEPERVMKKSKKYVIDVSNLRPAPMRFSHDPSLTKQDILRKLEELGYDVEHIDVDAATYFYIEPTEGAPSWQYDEYDTPIQYDYWVDYNTDLMDDPTYGGKYQIIDTDEFMFLIDNNLIGESREGDFDWVRDIMDEPITVCDATNVLGVGNIIMINKLPDWQDSDMVAGRVHKNITAEVLAIAPCNEIQPVNVSKSNTILIHVNDDYIGFDESWVREFKPEYMDRCLDGRCMFLVCGDKETNNMMITPMSGKVLESKKPINEVAGISFEARKWADIIYDEITSNPEEENRLIIDGYEYPEAFNGFPIDYVVIDFYDRLTGYGQEHSGYDKDGNYIVLLYVQPQLVRGQGGYSLKSALNHEMKHAWEDYNRLSKGLPSIEQTKESQELYNRDFILMLSDQNIRGPIKEILKYYYYLSNLEKSAYLENVYDQNPAYENMVREIASKDFEGFKGRFDLDVNWHLMNTAYNIPFLNKFKSPVDFIDYSAQELRSRALKMIKKMNKMKYIHGKL